MTTGIAGKVNTGGQMRCFLANNMPDKSIIINYKLCDFKQCIDGICRAKSECEKKVLKQEAPFEPPYVITSLCSGCNKCIAECHSNALEKSR